ncbi:hypothetical protein FKW50_06850 [Acetobacter pomorum]|uniref:hypothetical protein n=1 Tax=Acetobacter pomorum TaxID=65959 RepID=UPI001272A7EF|nr:hypothetical protein [Acetobacter pomorum]KAA8419964.1 hypothetical protein FKW54_14430 [Acetobacter pomorum]KAA8435534.1 hypothetical protein FKW50_06850 [Acetobacter pomorum]KAA8448333.1 hypothetical protein FKW52_13605 [Acetobacter pomorum]
MPTAIQTLKWRGFGFDRGDGFVELRFGVIGFAFTRKSLWSEVQELRETNAQLEQLHAELLLSYKTLHRRLVVVQAAVDMSKGLSAQINGEDVE